MTDHMIFEGKTILITGGTGSFGNAFLKVLLNSKAHEIRIFSRDEKKQDDMRKSYFDKRIKYYLGDVKDKKSLLDAFYNVDFIFHAAALKQVPSCEFFPMEAVKTNIIGTENVLSAAIEQKVKKVVCLSTDKAAYPINAMGISKAMMEKVMISKSKSVDPNQTLICGTRYGNVLASRGSVVPLFINQIKSGQPMTITNPKMTRFLMTLPDAVKLVIKAFSEGNPGDIFVQKSPASTIEKLASAVQALFETNSPIKVIGSRQGEKIYETLLTREEYQKAVEIGDYYKIPADESSLNYDKYFVEGDNKLDSQLEYNSNTTHQLDHEEILDMLKGLDYVQSELNGWNNE